MIETASFESSIKIKMPGGYCSGAFVSSSGHVVTAFHCLERCLKDQGKWHDNGTFAEPVDINLGEEELFCDSYSILGEIPQVIYLGSGISLANPSEVLMMPEEIVKKLSKLHNDFAILKINKVPPACSPIGVPSQALEKLYFISYPDITEIEHHNLSFSEGKFISVGEPQVFNPEKLMGRTLSAQEKSHLEIMYNPDKQLYSEIAATNGSSGGVLFDNEGRGLGIYSASLSGGFKNFIKLENIYNQIERRLGEVSASAFFNCNHVPSREK